eukprot:1158471-Pelagomonas_calceolata.AAC.5
MICCRVPRSRETGGHHSRRTTGCALPWRPCLRVHHTSGLQECARSSQHCQVLEGIGVGCTGSIVRRDLLSGCLAKAEMGTLCRTHACTCADPWLGLGKRPSSQRLPNKHGARTLSHVSTHMSMPMARSPLCNGIDNDWSSLRNGNDKDHDNTLTGRLCTMAGRLCGRPQAAPVHRL